MSPLRTLAAAALIAAFAGTALADPAFDAFRQVCADTRADFTAVNGVLDSQGWKAVDVQAATMEGVTVTDKVSRTNGAGNATLTLFAWQGTKGDIKISDCEARISKAKIEDLRAAATAWLGFAPQTADAKKQVWRFSDDGGARHALTNADFEAAAAGSGLEMLTISPNGAETIVDLLKIKK